MQWLTQNWFFVLLIVGFVALHVFGHSGHGGHGGRRHAGHGGGAEPRNDSDLPKGEGKGAERQAHRRHGGC